MKKIALSVLVMLLLLLGFQLYYLGFDKEALSGFSINLITEGISILV